MGLAGTPIDLGVIGEWAYDSRGGHATTIYENDAMFGLRLAANDAASSELLVGLIQDIGNSSRILSIEASRRIASNWKVSLQGWAFLDTREADPYHSLQDDHHLALVLAYYF